MGNAKRPRKNGDEYRWQDAVAELFTNKEFLTFAEQTVDKIATVMRERTEIEKERLQIQKDQGGKWEKVNLTFLWQKFILSVLALSGLGLATAYKMLPIELIGVLFTGIIASLFVQPRRQ